MAHKTKIELMATTAAPKIFVLVVEGKGGVGKSVASQVATFALGLDGSHVHVAESDLTNSTMAMVHGADKTTLVDASAADAHGYMYYLAERARDGEFDHVVFDTGARDETHLKPFITDLAKEIVTDYGMHLVVIRPMTVSHFVQTNILRFVEECKNERMGVVVLRNLSQGRNIAHFRLWEQMDSTKALLATPGVKLCDLMDAGVEHSDNVTSFGMTLVDAAAADFSKTGENDAYARQVVHRAIQIHLNKWLQRQGKALRAAIYESVGFVP